MPEINPLRDLPKNFNELVKEIAAGVTALYGTEAGEDYLLKAPRVFRATLAHPQIQALVCEDGGAAAGFLLATLRSNFAEISFVHVLRACRGQGVEIVLIREAVERLRAQGAIGIVCDFAPVASLDLEGAFSDLYFDRIERQLMSIPLTAPSLMAEAVPPTVAYNVEHWPEVAMCIVDAYKDHPGRTLHNEVRNPENAMDFVLRVAAGGYGAVSPGYQRAVFSRERCEGALLGCQVAPLSGFVLQIAVHRRAQKKGLGTALIRDFARALRSAGLEQMVLGVTLSNPARQWYEHLGFRVLQRTQAYAWWAR